MNGEGKVKESIVKYKRAWACWIQNKMVPYSQTLQIAKDAIIKKQLPGKDQI